MKLRILKFTTLLFAVMLLAGAASAQISLGVRAGINIANLNDDDDDTDTETITGLNIGILLPIAVSQSFTVQPELNFIQKGSSSEEEFLGVKFTSELVFNYLELPIMAKYIFGTERLGGFVQAGPSIGYALSGKIKVQDEEQDIDFDEDEVSRTDFGIQAGAGVSFAAGPGNLFLDARYLLGLSDISTEDSDEITVNTRGINISVGYAFPLN